MYEALLDRNSENQELATGGRDPSGVPERGASGSAPLVINLLSLEWWVGEKRKRLIYKTVERANERVAAERRKTILLHAAAASRGALPAQTEP